MGSIGHAGLRVPVGEQAKPAHGLSAALAQFLKEILHAQRPSLPWAMVAVVLAGLLLGAAHYVAAVTGNPIGMLLRDANAIAEQPQYFGAIDYAEVLLMSGAGWIALFAATFERRRSALFLGLGGSLSLLLALDNLYMLHESSWRFHLNEQMVFGFYGLLLALLVLTNLRRFLHSPFVLLGVAVLLFMLAVLVDALPLGAMPLPTGLEDMLELVGVCFWSLYFVKCSRDALLEQRRNPR